MESAFNLADSIELNADAAICKALALLSSVPLMLEQALSLLVKEITL